MNKEKALSIAQRYVAESDMNYDVIWYAGETDGWHFVWLKNTTLARYTGMGEAIKISPSGKIVSVVDGIELHQIAKAAVKLNNGYEFFDKLRVKK